MEGRTEQRGDVDSDVRDADDARQIDAEIERSFEQLLSALSLRKEQLQQRLQAQKTCFHDDHHIDHIDRYSTTTSSTTTTATTTTTVATTTTTVATYCAVSLPPLLCLCVDREYEAKVELLSSIVQITERVMKRGNALHLILLKKQLEARADLFRPPTTRLRRRRRNSPLLHLADKQPSLLQ